MTRPLLHLVLAGTLAALVGAACAPIPKRAYTPQELRSELATRLPDGPMEVIVPYLVTPADVARARRAIMREGTQPGRVRALIRAMFDPHYFGLKYAPGPTTNATDTLRNGYGNCLSLASVFVGLARGVGMRAHYLDVSDRVHETERVRDLVVRAGHVTAIVNTDNERIALDVGLGLHRFGLYIDMDDLEATTHFYNNRGYEALKQARASGAQRDWEQAASYFLAALSVTPDFVPAWNNLGVVYARLGRTDDALRSYQMAIRLDDHLSSPHANAGRLLLAHGRTREAVSFLEGALHRDPDSPGVRFELVLALARTGRLNQALETARPLQHSSRAEDARLWHALEHKRRLYTQ